MLDAVRHRGPDGRATIHEDGVTLGTCRLAFVDAPGGAQPMTSASGRCTIVWNGEVYNHRELRRELCAAGHSFRSTSDTELVVELYQREGPGFARRLRGMFALAIYDRRTRRLVLARDPWGKKPLYYWESCGAFVFASELGALSRHPDTPRRVDVRALLQYLLFRAVPAPVTLIDGVRKVPPGTWIEWSPGRPRSVTYWRMPPSCQNGRLSVAAAEAHVETALTAAVKRRITSTDVPLGVLLSGGLDSSLVTAIARRFCGSPLRTYSAGMEDPSYDETANAMRVARWLGTDHQVVRITRRDLADALVDDRARLDEPIADPSFLPTLLVCRAASADVRGLLSGDGADELFLGYRFFQVARALEILEGASPGPLLDRLVRLTERAPVRHTNYHYGSVLRQIARAVRVPHQRRYYAATAAFSPPETRALLTPEAWTDAQGSDPWTVVDAHAAEDCAAGWVERTQRGIVCHFLRDVILAKVDRAGMLNSVEVRSPFLDIDLAASLARVPASMNLRGWEGKRLLRKIGARYLPPDIVRRKKQGFRVPVGRLLCQEAAPLVREWLDSRRIASAGLFRPEVVDRLVVEHLSGHRDHAHKLWALLCFELWRDRASQLTACRST